MVLATMSINHDLNDAAKTRYAARINSYDFVLIFFFSLCNVFIPKKYSCICHPYTVLSLLFSFRLKNTELSSEAKGTNLCVLRFSIESNNLLLFLLTRVSNANIDRLEHNIGFCSGK